MAVWTPEYRLAYAKRYYLEHREIGRKQRKAWAAANVGKMRIYQNRKHLKSRQTVIAGYGGKCACCGEDRYEFLALDHVNGGGAAHRRQVGKDKDAIYRQVRDAGFPPEFRILCHNCNSAKGFYGYCPHERALPEISASAR